MSNEDIKNIQDDDFAEDYIVLTDEDGNERSFEFLDVVDYEEEEYLLLLPVEDTNEDEGEVIILKIESEDDETENYIGIDDQATLDAVFDIFKEKWKDEFNFE